MSHRLRVLLASAVLFGVAVLPIHRANAEPEQSGLCSDLYIDGLDQQTHSFSQTGACYTVPDGQLQPQHCATHAANGEYPNIHKHQGC